MKKLPGLILTALLLVIVFSTPVHYKVGGLFFGESPALYNVILAQFFFEHATNPLIGRVPPYAYHQLSRTYFIQGELTVALDLAYKEIALYPEHKSTYYIIGLTLGYLNREEEAIEAFGKFIEYKPESWAARNDRAWLQFRIGDIDGALTTIEPVAIFTNNPWVQNTYGTILLNMSRKDEARIAFENAKRVADTMSEEDWGSAYPGNDPRIYGTGLQAMKTSIENNLVLLK